MGYDRCKQGDNRLNNPSDLKPEVQVEMLRDLCKQIAEMDADWLAPNTEELLGAIVDVLENQSCEDAWGTEGWAHFFGYE